MKMPEIPDDHYLGLGRVTVAASKLEAMAAQCAAARLGYSEKRWLKLLGNPGGAMRALHKAANETPLVPSLQALHADIKAQLNARNRFVHSLVYFDASVIDVHGTNWVLVHPRSGKDIAMPTLEELTELARSMNAISARALGVMNEAATQRAEDNLRTGTPS